MSLKTPQYLNGNICDITYEVFPSLIIGKITDKTGVGDFVTNRESSSRYL